MCLALALVLGRSVLIRAPVGPAPEETSGSTLDVVAPEDAHVLRRSDALASQHRESVEASESEQAARLRRLDSERNAKKKRIADENRVRMLVCSMSIVGKTQVVLDDDDRVDVYFLVRRWDIAEKDLPDLYWSARSGSGPSKDEVLDGDYSSFPYTRFGGRILHGEVAIPLLWDRDPQPDGRRLVGFRGGDVKWMKEEDLQNLLRGLGQR